MNDTVKILLLTGAGVAFILIFIGGGFLLGKFTSINFQPQLVRDVQWQRFREWGCNHYSPVFKGMRPGGMMGYGFQEDLYGGDILSLEETELIVQEWLGNLDDKYLEIAEMMIFDNHAYVMIQEKSTGIGAMEILVDPVTLSVYPEHGANMMWNLKYSPMGSNHSWAWADPTKTTQDDIDNMPISPEEAVSAAQRYLDKYSPGTEADNHAIPFYGYYTLHILEDDQVIGMLSVNGYSAEVLFHSWHGKLLETSEH